MTYSQQDSQSGDGAHVEYRAYTEPDECCDNLEDVKPTDFCRCYP